MTRRWIRLIGLSPVLLLQLLMLISGCGEPRSTVPQVTGPLAESIYVWQRQWTPAVARAVQERAKEFERSIVLGAEVDWRGGQVQVAQVRWQAAAFQGRQVGVALRISPKTHGFGTAGPELHRTAVVLLTRARASGLNALELQVDYDAPTSGLAEYAQWLRQLRPMLTGAELTITALPTWLKSERWPAVALACDSFVLQVHALVAPRGPDHPARLCDPQQAHWAVQRAAETGRPFRVALPTYSYGVAFDAQGKLLGLAAEGPVPALPLGGVWQELQASPEEITGLLSSWRLSRPALLRGLVWFRLPVDGDRRNWAWPTLQAVRAGRVPVPRLKVAWQRGDQGTWELVAVNGGELDATLPDTVRAPMADAQEVAADALGGYGLRRQAGALEFVSSGRIRLGPRQRRLLGWLRPLTSDARALEMAEVTLDL